MLILGHGGSPCFATAVKAAIASDNLEVLNKNSGELK
jgi:hypothetical protein